MSLARRLALVAVVLSLAPTALTAPASAITVDDPTLVPPPNTHYVSETVQTNNDIIPVEIVALSLRSTSPTTVPDMATLGQPGDTEFFVDSFFDISYTIDIGGGAGPIEETIPDEQISYSYRKGSETLGDVVIVRELDKSSVKLFQSDQDPDVTIELTLKDSEYTLTELPDGNWSVDSFFDISYRISSDGGATFPYTGEIHAPLRIIPEPTTAALVGLGALALFRRRRA